MHEHRISTAGTPSAEDAHRLRYLHLVAAARAAALCPTDEQQVADVVRVTVDDEVDTTTFRAIVTEVSRDVLR
ncbi:hypothetical protein [Blastococcus sp. URHD0036]|uniref:hypothetical protein n=1 Tax=Blastococcus sp. URHD0036 TaxID=1380356 RepID=UPI0004951D31|nr:hypothetical protein [Blastococcus sp. URHD0036]